MPMPSKLRLEVATEAFCEFYVWHKLGLQWSDAHKLIFEPQQEQGEQQEQPIELAEQQAAKEEQAIAATTTSRNKSHYKLIFEPRCKRE
jgi:hypothetical protein